MAEVNEGFKIVFKGDSEGLERASAKSAAAIGDVIKAANKIGNTDSFKPLTNSAQKAVKSINSITGNLKKLQVDYVLPNFAPLTRTIEGFKKDLSAAFLDAVPAPQTGLFTRSIHSAVKGAIREVEGLKGTRIDMGQVQPPDLSLLKRAIELSKKELSKAVIVTFPPVQMPRIEPVRVPPLDKREFDASIQPLQRSLTQVNTAIGTLATQAPYVPAVIPPDLTALRKAIDTAKKNIESVGTIKMPQVTVSQVPPLNTTPFDKSVNNIASRVQLVNTLFARVSSTPIYSPKIVPPDVTPIRSAIEGAKKGVEGLQMRLQPIVVPKIEPIKAPPIDTASFYGSAIGLEKRIGTLNGLFSSIDNKPVPAPPLLPPDTRPLINAVEQVKKQIAAVRFAEIKMPTIQPVVVPPITTGAFDKSALQVTRTVQQIIAEMKATKVQPFNIPTPIPPDIDLIKKWVADIKLNVATLSALPKVTIDAPLLQPVNTAPFAKSVNDVVSTTQRLHNAMHFVAPTLKTGSFVGGVNDAISSVAALTEYVKRLNVRIAAPSIGAINNAPFLQSATEVEAKTRFIQNLLNQFGKTRIAAPTVQKIDYSQAQSDTVQARANVQRVWGAPLVSPKVDFNLPPIPPLPPLPLPPLNATEYLRGVNALLKDIRDNAAKGVTLEILSPDRTVLIDAEQIIKRLQKEKIAIPFTVAAPNFDQVRKMVADVKADFSKVSFIKMPAPIIPEIKVPKVPTIPDPFTKVNKGAGAATFALTNLGRVAQDSAFGFVGIANNINPLVESFQALSREAKATGTTMRSQLLNALKGGGGLGLAFSALTAALSFASVGLTYWGSRANKAAKETDKLREAQEAAKKVTEQFLSTLSDVNRARLEGAQSAQQELVSVQLLYKASQDQNRTYKDRKQAVDQLQTQYPAYFKNIKDEVILAGGAELAYNKLTTAILASARARAAQDTLVGIQKELLTNEERQLDVIQKESDAFQAMKKAQATLKNAGSIGQGAVGYARAAANAERAYADAVKNTSAVIDERNKLQKRAKDLADELSKAPIDAIAPPQAPKTGAARELKDYANFYEKFFDFDPNKLKLTEKQVYSLMEAARSFSKEQGGTFEGLNFENEKEPFEAAKKWWVNYRKGLIRFKPNAFIKFDPTLVPEIKVDPIGTDQIAKYIDTIRQVAENSAKDIPTTVDVRFEINAAYNRGLGLRALSDEFEEAGKQVGGRMGAAGSAAFGKVFRESLNAATRPGMKALSPEQLQLFKDELTATAAIQMQLFSGVADSIGAMTGALLEGGDGLKAFGQSMIGVFKSLAIQLAKTAAMALILSAVSGGAAGGGLSFGKAFGKLLGMKDGGIIPGGFSGDRFGPVMLNSGEAVIPLDKLDRYLNTGNSSQPQGQQRVRLRGTDLMLQTARTSRQQRRLS